MKKVQATPLPGLSVEDNKELQEVLEENQFNIDLEEDAQTALSLLPTEASSPYLSPTCTGLATQLFLELREERKRRERQNRSVEQVAQKVHDIWMQNKVRQGFHRPEHCTQKASGGQQQGVNGLRGCQKCHLDILPWESLVVGAKARKMEMVENVLKAAGVITGTDKE